LNELDYLEFQRCPVLTRVDLRGLHRLNDLLLMDTPSLTSLDVGQPTDMNALYLNRRRTRRHQPAFGEYAGRSGLL
jgi:hypothetical protein